MYSKVNHPYINICAQSCPALCHPMDCSPPDSSACGIYFPGNNTGLGCHFLHQKVFLTQGEPKSLVSPALAGGFFTTSTTWEAHQSVQFSRSVVSDSVTPWIAAGPPPCPLPTPGVHSDSCPLSRWCHPAISSSVVPFSSCPNPSQHQGLFQWVNSSHQVAKVLEFRL